MCGHHLYVLQEEFEALEAELATEAAADQLGGEPLSQNTRHNVSGLAVCPAEGLAPSMPPRLDRGCPVAAGANESQVDSSDSLVSFVHGQSDLHQSVL